MLSYRRMVAVLTAMVLCVHSAEAQHDHSGEPGHHSHLHFSHPLISESPSPDTKVRLDYDFQRLDEGEEAGVASTINLDAEYAFHRSFSIEVGVPLVFVDLDEEPAASNLGTIEVALKFANFAFEQHGLLLGYGLAFGLPTGDEAAGIGSDHLLEVEPFLNVGLQRDRLEIVGFTLFGIPTNQEEGEEVETEFGYNLSVLYHVNPRIQGLIELDGETVLSGVEDESVANVTPGFKLRPLASSSLLIGLGVNIPVAEDREHDLRVIASLFYHF